MGDVRRGHVYEEVTGDFDKVLRVEYQDASSQWARAGLIARDVTNFGVDRATQTGSGFTDPPYDGTAGRYQKVHVNPVRTAMGTPGNNSWEGNRRLQTGAAADSAGGGGTPLYPNAWCRLQRVGQTFTIFRSDNGVDWTQLGASTFDPAMPDKLFVGPEFSPENGNISDVALKGVFVAKFRDYGNFSVAPPEFVSITVNPNGTVTVAWTGGGTLQYTTSLTPPVTWADAPAGSVSPFTLDPSQVGPIVFGRIKK